MTSPSDTAVSGRAASMTPERSSTSRMFPALATALGACMLLGLHAWLYLPFIADDALISLRYARHLAQGEGLVWSAGHPVEGYSNLLWVLLTAGYGALGGDLITGARLLGLLAMAGAICAMIAAAMRSAGKKDRSAMIPGALAGSLALALSGSVAAWAVGGLEQPLLALLLAWGTVLLYPLLETERPHVARAVFCGIVFGLLVLTRPDAPLFPAAALIAVLAMRRFDATAWRTVLTVGGIVSTLAIAQLLFRLAYYGEWLPNTALVKLGVSLRHLGQGANYVIKWCGSVLPLFLLVAVGLRFGAVDARSRRRLLLLAAMLVPWLLYVITIGGDIFPGRRHMVVATVLLALAAVEAASALARRSMRLSVIAISATLLFFVPLQWIDPANVAARTERWEWDGAVIGRVLGRAFGRERPTIALSVGGCVPYWSDLPAIDMLGLNDYYIPRHPPRRTGQGWIGHELGDGSYVLARHPDLVLLCDHVGGDTACFVGERQLLALPEFRSAYRMVTLEGREPHLFRARIWGRLESPAIGITRSAGAVTIPGWLFASAPGAVARLDERGVIGCTVTRDAAGGLDSITMPAGRWRVEIAGSAAIRLLISIHGQAEPDPVPLVQGSVLVLDAPAALDLRLLPLEGENAHVRQIRLIGAASGEAENPTGQTR
jgi:hypothetical protein